VQLFLILSLFVKMLDSFCKDTFIPESRVYFQQFPFVLFA
jgi:hypothetical protein